MKSHIRRRVPEAGHQKSSGGFSLVEILVVVVVFAVLAVIATQTIFLSIRGSNKSQAQISVREDLDYALAVMERNIRNADTVTCPGNTSVVYEEDTNARFICNTSVDPMRIDWDDGSGAVNEITPDTVDITTCSFVCNAGVQDVPDSVDVAFSANSLESGVVEGASVSVNTSILLRTY